MDVLIYICEKCKKSEVEVYNVLGDYCLDCWEDITTPDLTKRLNY
jgi:hypothetical protein